MIQYMYIFLKIEIIIDEGDCMSDNINNTEKNSKGLCTSVIRYINGDDAKLESNIIDVNKSNENYIKNHEGIEKPKFKFFDYTMNTYLILFTITTTLTILFSYFFIYR